MAAVKSNPTPAPWWMAQNEQGFSVGHGDAELLRTKHRADAKLIALCPEMAALVKEAANLCAYEEADDEAVADFRLRAQALLKRIEE